MTEYSRFFDVPNYSNFHRTGKPLLVQALSNLFSCDVEFSGSAAHQFCKRFGVDITAQPRRTTYVIDTDTALLVSRVMHDRTVLCHLGLVLRRKKVSSATGLLNTTANALTHSLTISHNRRYKDAPIMFGDELIRKVISNHLAAGRYDPFLINYAIGFLYKLANSTFENIHYTSGLIFTRSLHAYTSNKDSDRCGETYCLQTPCRMRGDSGLDKRFWFIADGHNSFYLATRDFTIRHLFIRRGGGATLERFPDAYTLSKTLCGGDIAMRTTGRGEFSLVSSRGEEFTYVDNTWRYRDLALFSHVLEEQAECSASVATALLYYLLYCSQSKISSILWIPENVETAPQMLISYNSVLQLRADVTCEDHACLLKRYLASDGATIISRSGEVHYFGCIVDLSRAKVHGVKGTGECAARLLAANGIAIKVSQDGNIKVFFNPFEEPLVL